MDISAEEEIMDINQLKVVLIGQSSVGKTALINQYINKLFIDTSITTIGTDKFSKIEEINNTEIKINIWDTAGQERFRSLSHLFLKGANIVLMVYDITNQDSFNELKQFWIERVNDNTKNIILGIIANKSDLYENEVVSINDGMVFFLKFLLKIMIIRDKCLFLLLINIWIVMVLKKIIMIIKMIKLI